MKNLFVFFLSLILFSACMKSEKPVPAKVIIAKETLKLSSNLMTPEVLWSFGRVAGAQVSPDGTMVLYSVSYYSIPENKGNSEIFVMNADGSDKRQITRTATCLLYTSDAADE